MSATSELRARLDERGRSHIRISDYVTIAAGPRVASLRFVDTYDGHVFAEYTKSLTPDEAAEIADGPTATMRVTVDEDGIGRAECECGRTVGQWFAYCPWCGCRFIRREREYHGQED